MQAPNIYPFSQTQPQALPGFTYGPPQLVFDHSAPRVDPLHSTVTINSPLPLQHYNGPNAHINSANNNYAYYYHHPNNNDNNNNNNNNHSNNTIKNNNINSVLPAVNIQISNNSHYRNTHQIPSAPQRLVSIIPDPHMPPNISHFQLNNIHPQMHAPVATDIHFQQVPVYNKTNNGIGTDNINNDKPVNSNQNEVLDNIDERSCHEINRVVSFSKHFENNELTTTANDLNIQSTMDELAKLKSLSNSTHFRQSIATQNFHSLQNHITTIENRLASLLTDRQQEQQQLKQQESEKEGSSPFSNKIKLPSLQELTDSISTQHLPTFYDNKRHASDTDLKSSTLHGPLYHRHAFLSTSSSSPSPTAGSVPLQKLQVPRQDDPNDKKMNISSSPFNSITYIPNTTLSPMVQTQLKNLTTSNLNTKKKNNRGRPRAIQRQPTLTTSSHFINNSNPGAAAVSTTTPAANSDEKNPNAKKIIEFCFHCGETETPEWRKGPYGTRTLCNACGLFYRKVTKKFGSKSSNLLLRYRRSIDLANDRRIPDFITIPNRFIHDMDNDQTLDSEYNTILQ
ncbi:CFF_collapsed_G0042810.mRNA.1.CDS.1 [Saccharomyces cerevisiae]|nr:BPK_HP1_G0041410.mRNA.1.CDS.1 [Saccharomyces cerevisiae]CAI7408106.1 BPK_collapsed_G0041760.mRNA.1.CDS.1 [Saccharomyces cerevisiae]CAI7432292.1 CFF_collapsed_G0042810.mRNA.1.CDS.1 [Saccharomyces cerevisiae]